MFEWIYSPEAWLAFVTLTSLEIVLGIDNIIFISILVARLPEHQRNRARIQGLVLIGEGLDMHIPKGYIYFAMGFSVMVEMFNIHTRKKRAEPVNLHRTMPGQPGD